MLTRKRSFSILIISQIPYNLTGGSVVVWYGWLHGFVAVTIITAFLLFRLRRSYSAVNLSEKWSEVRAERMGLIVVGGGFASYHFFVGPYTEIPSDFWAHLGRVVDEQYLIREEIYPIGKGFLALLDYPGFVHFLHGVVAELLSVHPLVIVNEVTLVTSLLFVFIYYRRVI